MHALWKRRQRRLTTCGILGEPASQQRVGRHARLLLRPMPGAAATCPPIKQHQCQRGCRHLSLLQASNHGCLLAQDHQRPKSVSSVVCSAACAPLVLQVVAICTAAAIHGCPPAITDARHVPAFGQPPWLLPHMMLQSTICHSANLSDLHLCLP